MFSSRFQSRTVFRSLSAGTTPGGKTRQGNTVMSHNDAALDMLLIKPLKWTGRCRPITTIGQFTSKTLQPGGRFCHESQPR